MTAHPDAMSTSAARSGAGLVGGARSRSGMRLFADIGVHLAVPWPARFLLGGIVVGALLVLIDPLVAAVAALVVAAVGIGLSEARRRERATLYASLGLMAPALADVIAQLVRLL